MPLPPIKTQFFSNPPTADQVRRLQQAVDEATRPVFACPLVDGRLLEGIELGTGSNVLSHGLSRTLKGWILTRVSAQVTISDLQVSNATPERTLVLDVSAPCTVSVW